MPEEQSVWPAMAWPIRMDAGILCDRAQQSFRRLPSDCHQPAIFPTRLSHLKQHAHPLKATPKSQQERPAMPEEQSVWPAMAWPIRMDAGILCDRA